MSWLVSVLSQAAVGVLLGLGLSLMLFAAELNWPRGTMPTMVERKRALVFLLVYAPIAAGITSAFWMAFDIRYFGLHPLFEIRGWWPAALATVPLIFVGDLFYYWLHRAQHHFKFLWRYHATHHSIEQMGVPTGYVHVTDPLFRALFTGLPLALLVNAETVANVMFLLVFHGYYLHSATALHFGRFAWVITDNHVHRVHHSRDPAHFNTNYGITTMLWDKLFGTDYFPKPNEWPEVGLDDVPEPKTVREFLLHPWIDYERGKAAVGGVKPAV